MGKNCNKGNRPPDICKMRVFFNGINPFSFGRKSLSILLKLSLISSESPASNMSSDADASSSSPGEYVTSVQGDQAKTQPTMNAGTEVPEPERFAQETIRDYLLENVKEFHRLHELKREVCL